MKSSRRKKVFVGLGIGLLLFFAALIIVPWFLNPDYLKDVALRQIQKTFGSHVSVGHTTFALFPHPHFLISDITVQERPESHAIFRARSLRLELGIGQLLQKKIVVRELFLDHPEIELHRNREGEWRFLGHTGRNSPLSSFAPFLVIGNLVVTNGKIIVIDESPQDSVRGFVLEEFGGFAETIQEDDDIESTLTLSGKLRQNQDVAPFHLTGMLALTLGEALSATDSPTASLDDAMFTGSGTAEGIDMAQWAEYFPHAATLSHLPGPVDIASQVHWEQNSQGSHVQLSDISLGSATFRLGGTINVEGLEDGHRMTTVSVRSSTVDMALIQNLIPPDWLSPQVPALTEHIRWGGELEVQEARITGSTRPDVGTSITGTFQVKKGFVAHQGWPKTEGIRGAVVVEPDRIKFSEARGTYDGIPFQVKQGLILLKETGPWGEVEVEGKVPARKVWDFVLQLGNPREAPPVLSGWEVTKGGGNLRLQFSGPVLSQEGLSFQKGDYQFQGLVVRTPGLPHNLERGAGRMVFSPDNMVLDNIQGYLGTHPLEMNGTILYHPVLRVEPLQIVAGVDGEDLFHQGIPPSDDSQPSLAGPLNISLGLRGPLVRAAIKGKVEGTQASLRIPSIIDKGAGQVGTLEFDAALDSRGRLRFERLDLAMLPLRLQGQGVVQLGSRLRWEGRLQSDPIYLGLLPDNLRVLGGRVQSGILEIQLSGKGQGYDWSKWNTNGWVALTEGVIEIPGIRDPMTNMFVRMKIDRDRIELKRLQFRMQESEAVITGFMKNWRENPQVSLFMESPQFDIDLIIPKKERTVLRDGVEWLANHGTLEGALVIQKPRYKHFSGEKLSAQVKIHDNLISIDKILTMVETTGELEGRMFIRVPPGKPAAMRASFQARDLPVGKLLLTMGDEARLITGRLDIRGMVQGHGRDSRGVVPTLNGGLEFSLKNGYVRKGTILPKIIALLNLPQALRGKVDIEEVGFPFNEVTANVTLKDGRFSTQEFLVNSTITKTTVAGSYDLAGDHVEGVAVVSPFGTYADVLKTIPLFGTILKGERRGIATAIFNISGSLSDPQVEYMPLESFQTGLSGLAQLAFDMLKNTLMIPVDLIKNETESTSGETPPAPVPSQ